MVVALAALLFEVVGLVLKVPGLRQVFQAGGLRKLLVPGGYGNSLIQVGYKLFMGLTVSLAILGRVVFGFFLILFALNAFYGAAHPEDAIRNALVVYALVQTSVVFVLLIHSGMSKSSKHTYSSVDPPLHFMIRNGLGDLFLLSFSALSFSIIWHTMFTNPNLQPIDYGNPLEIVEQAVSGFFLFAMVYLPANLTHFFAHTVSIRRESRLQRGLYWFSWLLTIVLALAPYF